MTDKELFDRAFDIVDRYRSLPPNSIDNPMNSTKSKMYRYDIEVPEDIHWTLVGLAAANKMDHETYVEEVLVEYGGIAIARAATELGEQTED